MVTLTLLFVYSIINIADSNCKWDISGYGIVDLSPLSNYTINATRDGAEAYQLLYSPCSNSILCELIDASAIAMATQMGPNDPSQCNGVISKWDNDATVPKHEINKNNQDQIVFNYPVQENLSGAGCTEGREGEFVFVCNETVDPFNVELFYQDAGSNPCVYHIIIQTKYACSNTHSDCIWSSNNGKNILNMSSIAGNPLSKTIDQNVNYVYIPCMNSNTIKCNDGIFAMVFLFDSSAFECTKYLAVWEDGIVEPEFTEELRLWRFVYENGESCDGLKDILIVEWICDKSATTPEIVQAGEISECVYQLNINSTLACE